MNGQNTLMMGGLLLVGLMAPVQFAAILKMRDDVTRGFRELAERHGMEMASAMSLLAFAGYAFVPAIVAKGDWLYFRETVPFKTLYYLSKTLLHAPQDQPDLSHVFVLLWSAIAFIIPALVYGAINAKVASIIYGKMR